MCAPILSSLDGLRVIDRVIRTPGEFYAERWFVPYYAGKVKKHHYAYREKDSTGEVWAICHVTEEERRVFPDLANVATVGIRWEGSKCNSWTRSCSWQKRT